MAHRNLFRRRYYLLPKEPFQFGIKKTSNPYLIALHTFLQTFNLKHVNRIEYAFDPFHDNAKVIRNCMFHTSGDEIRASNPKCTIRNTVLTDRSDPTMRVQLDNGQQLIYNASNLTELEVLQHIDKTKRLLDVDPEDQAPAAAGR